MYLQVSYTLGRVIVTIHPPFSAHTRELDNENSQSARSLNFLAPLREAIWSLPPLDQSEMKQSKSDSREHRRFGGSNSADSDVFLNRWACLIWEGAERATASMMCRGE